MDLLARAGAITLGATYAAGFVVVNLHHAQLGIPDLSLLRARVVGAGFLSLVMTLLPIIGTARVYGLFGLRTQGGVAFRTRPEDEHVGQIIYMLVLYQLCFALAIVTEPFFGDTSQGLASWLPYVLSAAVLAFASEISYRHPWKCAGLAAAATIVVGWSAWLGWGPVFFARSIWFYFCAIATVWFRDHAGEPEKLRKLRIEVFIGLPLFLLVFFSTIIYGNAEPQFGGGAPIPVLVHLSPELSKVLGSEAMSGWLIEQTEDALYIQRARSAGNAILVPRSQIRAVEFNYNPSRPPTKQQ